MGLAAETAKGGVGGGMIGLAAETANGGVGGGMIGLAANAQLPEVKTRTAENLRKLIKIDIRNTPLKTLYRKSNPQVE